MSQFTGVKCDGCGKTKGETNHWFIVGRHRSGRELSVNPYLIPLSEKDYENFDLCGESCVQKKLSELLQGLHSEQGIK